MDELSLPKFWLPKTLILGPGGTKGFLLVGALLFLERTSLFESVDTIIGVSIGSVIGLLINIGMNATQILELSLSTSLTDIISSLDISQIKSNAGLFSHSLFRDKLNEVVKERYGFVPTLHQLYMMTGIKYVSTTSNLTKKTVEYLSYESDPQLSCVEAVLMSMNIPGFFHRYVYNGCIMIDGGFGDPLPLKYADTGDRDIFAILLHGSDTPSTDLSYLFDVIKYMLHQKEEDSLKDHSDRCKLLKLSYPVNEPIGFQLTFEQKVDMVIIGYTLAFESYSELSKIYPELYPLNTEGVITYSANN